MDYNSKSFHITIADITFLVRLNGAESEHLHKRLKKAFIEFVFSGKNPPHRIKISCKHKGHAFGFTRKGKTLEVLTSKKILKGSSLWGVFVDMLIKYLRDFVLSYPDIILLHSAACTKNNKGYLFLGPSHSGKTTVAKFSRGYSVLSDDKALIKRMGKKYYLFHMPLLSYEFKKLQKNIKRPIPIDKIFLLKKSKAVQFKKVSRAQAMAALLERTKDLNRLFKPDIKKAFDISYGMASSIPAFEMHFKKDSSFWQHIGRL